MSDIPPLPDGFELEQLNTSDGSTIPALPEGFVIEGSRNGEIEPTPKGAYRGTVLPFEKNLVTGEVSLAMPALLQGVIDSGTSAFTAPYRAMTGQLPMTDDAGSTSPEAIAEGFNMATWASPATAGRLSKVAPEEAARQTVIDVASKYGRPGNQVGLAAQRIGVELPRAVTTDSKIVQSVGKGLENQPLIGSPLLRANEKALSQIDDAAKAVQDEFGTGSIPNAGAQTRAAFTKYSKQTLRGKENANYDKVGDLIKQNGMTPLDKTAEVWLDIVARRKNATLPEGPAVQLVREAVFRQDSPPPGANLKVPVKPGDTVESIYNLGRGLNFNGIKDLRSYIRETLDNPGAITQSGMSEQDLERIYKALSGDLRTSVDRWGGHDAKIAFEQANSFSAKANMEREKLQSILGTAKSDEAVFDTLAKLAGTNSRADINKLFLARKAVDRDTWDEIASGVISQMGRDADGNFSPARFLTARGKLSETGKAMLFNTTGKKDLAKTLEDIEAVSRRMAEVNKNYGNPSGTARNLGWATIGAAFTNAIVNPGSITPVAGGIAGGNLLARYLAKPDSAKTVLEYLKAAEMAQTKPSIASNQMLNAAATRLGRMAAADLGAPNRADDLISQLLLQKAASQDNNDNDKQGRPVASTEANDPDEDFNEAYLQGRGA